MQQAGSRHLERSLRREVAGDLHPGSARREGTGQPEQHDRLAGATLRQVDLRWGPCYRMPLPTEASAAAGACVHLGSWAKLKVDLDGRDHVPGLDLRQHEPRQLNQRRRGARVQH